jgi:hypothetical protein
MAAKEDGTSLQASVTDNKVYLDTEDQRQYDESRKFIEANPQYESTSENNNRLLDYLENHNMRLTAITLQSAYDHIFNGAPEPKVMTPAVLFKNVEPLKFEPISPINAEQWDEDPEYDALMKEGIWAGDVKPGLKTVAGAIKNDDNESFKEIAQQLALMAIMEQQKFLNAKAEQESWKKPVAKMPEAWYSNEVVELNSGRRIKDDTD